MLIRGNVEPTKHLVTVALDWQEIDIVAGRLIATQSDCIMVHMTCVNDLLEVKYCVLLVNYWSSLSDIVNKVIT